MKCVENGCLSNVSEGDLLFCRIRRGEWKDICNNPLANISNNLRILTQIGDERLASLRK